MMTRACVAAIIERMGKVGAVDADVLTKSAASQGGAMTLEETTALLAVVSRSARSGSGVANALAELLRMLRQCSWVHGELRMEIVADEDRATVSLFTERGSSRERILGPVTLRVPFQELETAVHANPSAFAPLQARGYSGRIIFTSGPNAHEKPTLKRPMYVLPEEALRSGTHVIRDPRREED